MYMLNVNVYIKCTAAFSTQRNITPTINNFNNFNNNNNSNTVIYITS